MAASKQGNTIGAYEAKTRFSEILNRVENGEEVTITRHGMPVARLTPVTRKSTPQQRKAAIEAMRALSQKLRLGGIGVKELISEGRR